MAGPKYTPKPATVRELKARVKSYEAELMDTIDQIQGVLQDVVDWKQHIEKHPVRFAVGAAAMGLAVGLKPSFIPAAGGRGIQAILGLGLRAILGKLRARFF
jgi:hypothetical protein